MWCPIYYLILPAWSLLSPLAASCREDDTSWVTVHAFPTALLHPLLARFLTWWPWPLTLTFKLDLDILQLDLHAEIQVCISVRLPRRVVTHGHTDRQTHNVKTITPVTDEGCKNRKFFFFDGQILLFPPQSWNMRHLSHFICPIKCLCKYQMRHICKTFKDENTLSDILVWVHSLSLVTYCKIQWPNKHLHRILHVWFCKTPDLLRPSSAETLIKLF